ncbi:MAG: molybdopterin molybdotransferase MoeA [Desulfobulbaceae bacterium]|nr:molybdopterin molybdotransferase MoeA [Desulfobulbaceae bacterium]
MKGFFQLLSSSEFRALFAQFHALQEERISMNNGLGRILARDITAPEPLPPFSRSTMDGYAVRAQNTFGCSESEPALIEIAGEISMGKPGRELSLKNGQAAAISTGGELPQNSDAVVMIEYSSRLDDRIVEIFRPVAPGENVIQCGEDFARDAVVLTRGHQLRPQDLGVLSGLGISRIPVYRQPVVAIISTGDELVEPDKPLLPGKIRDINSTTLAALVQESGGIPVPLGIVGDEFDRMFAACTKALEIPADMVLLSGGSSVGRRDFTLKVLEGIAGTELLAHGVSIRPGKPTILARRDNVALFGLPGHVGSAIVVFHLFVRPLLRKLSGCGITSGLQRIQTVTGEQIPSVIGREDYIRVSLKWDESGTPPTAMPIYGKSGLLNPLIRAQGLLMVDRDTEGLDQGETAEVILFI